METTGHVREFISYSQDAKGNIHEVVTRTNPLGNESETLDTDFLVRSLIVSASAITDDKLEKITNRQINISQNPGKYDLYAVPSYENNIFRYKVVESETPKNDGLTQYNVFRFISKLLDIHGTSSLIDSSSSGRLVLEFPETMPIGKKNFIIYSVRRAIEVHLGVKRMATILSTSVEIDNDPNIPSTSGNTSGTSVRPVDIIEHLFMIAIVTDVSLIEELKELINSRVSKINKEALERGLYVEVDFIDVSKRRPGSPYTIIRYNVIGILKKSSEYISKASFKKSPNSVHNDSTKELDSDHENPKPANIKTLLVHLLCGLVVFYFVLFMSMKFEQSEGIEVINVTVKTTNSPMGYARTFTILFRPTYLLIREYNSTNPYTPTPGSLTLIDSSRPSPDTCGDMFSNFHSCSYSL